MCFLSAYHQRLLFSMMQFSNQMLYYFLLPRQFCITLFAYSVFVLVGIFMLMFLGKKLLGQIYHDLCFVSVLCCIFLSRFFIAIDEIILCLLKLWYNLYPHYFLLNLHLLLRLLFSYLILFPKSSLALHGERCLRI